MTHDPADARYTSAHLRWQPLGGDHQVLLSVDRAPIVVPNHLAEMLTACTEFRRLDEHAAACALDRSAALAQLRAFAGVGILISEEQCLAQHDRAVSGAGDPGTIESVGIVTCNRPALLRRCLDSVAGALERAGRRPRLIVADDSGSDDVRAHNRAALAEVGDRGGFAVRYLGRDEKTQLVERLTELSGVPRPLVELAFRGVPGFSVTTGGNRNVLLAATAGELTFQVDDDVTWRTAAASEQRPGIRHAMPSEDPSWIRFHADRAAALAALPASERDGIRPHEALLGRTLGTVLESHLTPDRPIVEGTIDHLLLRHLVRGSGRVVATSFGIVGDAATWSPHPLLLLRGRSRDHLLAGWDHILTREVDRAAPQVTLMRGGFFMSTAVGLDNRALLPPFFPVARNQDGSFGALVPLCSPASYFAHLPWLVAHEPETRRDFDPSTLIDNVGRIRVCDLVIESMRTWSPASAGGSPSQRMGALGSHLEWLGALTRSDFAELMRDRQLRSLDRQRRSLQESLQGGAVTPALSRVAADQLERIEARVTAPDLVSPIDLPGDDPLDRVQRAIAAFGGLLRAWPAVVDAADDLRDTDDS